jgi:hypothetical protein
MFSCGRRLRLCAQTKKTALRRIRDRRELTHIQLRFSFFSLSPLVHARACDQTLDLFYSYHFTCRVVSLLFRFAW